MPTYDEMKRLMANGVISKDAFNTWLAKNPQSVDRSEVRVTHGPLPDTRDTRVKLILDENLIIPMKDEYRLKSPDGLPESVTGDWTRKWYQRVGDDLSKKVKEDCERVTRRSCCVSYVGAEKGDGCWVKKNPDKYREGMDDEEYRDAVEGCVIESASRVQNLLSRGEYTTFGQAFKYCMRGKKPRRSRFIWKPDETVLPPKSSDDTDILVFAEQNQAYIVSNDVDIWLESKYKSDRILIELPEIEGNYLTDLENYAEAIRKKLDWMFNGL